MYVLPNESENRSKTKSVLRFQQLYMIDKTSEVFWLVGVGELAMRVEWQDIEP